MRSFRFPLFLVLLLSLVACGGQEPQNPASGAAASTTLYVRASGMVKSLGIT